MGNFLVDFSKIIQVQCDHVVSTFQILKGLKNIQHCWPAASDTAGSRAQEPHRPHKLKQALASQASRGFQFYEGHYPEICPPIKRTKISRWAFPARGRCINLADSVKLLIFHYISSSPFLLHGHQGLKSEIRGENLATIINYYFILDFRHKLAISHSLKA